MPRARSVRIIIAEIVLYIGMFAIVAHMTQNLYERFMMHSELNMMKSDLNSLEVMVNHIGIAYDCLRDEVQNVYLTNKETSKSDFKSSSFKPAYDCYLLHKQKHSAVQCPPELVHVTTSSEVKTKDFMQNFKKSTNNFMQEWKTPVEDETTFTERIFRCISAGYDGEKANNKTDNFCKCIFKCISHPGDQYKLVNLQNFKIPNKFVEEQESITNETTPDSERSYQT